MFYRSARNHSRPRRNSFGKSNGRRFRERAFDPSVLVKNWSQQQNVVEEEVYAPVNTFPELPISQIVKKNLLSHGFHNPTQIQDQVIPLLLEGKDVVGVANTGTGKTAAFLVPFINKIINNRVHKLLIIVPTRELAVQIEAEFRVLARHCNLYSVVCIGGVGMGPQIQNLSRDHNLVVGTPGRLRDLEKQRRIRFADYDNIVLDEVDRMLDMGFIHDVNNIISALPTKRQSAGFSATLPQSVQLVLQRFLKEPITVMVKREVIQNLTQEIVKLNGKPKVEVLHDLLLQDGFEKVLVFGKTKWGLEKLADDLGRRGFKIAAIHGNKRQSQRQQSLDRFRRNQVSILLATDVASRGLDIQGVTHVINYDLPETHDDYIHRIGRTGRANNKGVALTLVD